MLFGKTRRLVLGLVFGHPDEAFYIREIVRRTGQSPGAVQRELELLARVDVLRRITRGHQVYFEVNRESPVFTELQGLVFKTTGIVEVLRAALRPFADRIVAAFIFGSAARAKLQRNSDVDVFIVGNVSFFDLVLALRPAQLTLAREINPTVYTPDEFAHKIRGQTHFVRSLRDEPRNFILGNDHELGRLEAEWLGARPRDKRPGNPRPARGGGTRSGGQRSQRSKR